MTPEQLEFSQRIRPYLRRLDAFVASRVAHQYVDDICSEVIAISWQKRENLPADDSDDRDPLLGFLFSTARFQIKNLERRLNTSYKHMDHFAASAIADSAETEALRDEAAVLAFKALSPKDRDLLIMVAWDGLTVPQVAHILGITENNVSVRLTRARARLAAQLAAEDAKSLAD